MEDLDERAPRPDALEAWFHLTETRVEEGRIVYYGESLVPRKRLIRELWPEFNEAGYEIRLAQAPGRGDALVAEPVDRGIDGFPWTNVVLFLATVLSTLFVGAYAWYFVPFDDIVANPLVVLRAWPFTAAVLGVLMVHEFGHYAMGRYHGVDVSLPYVIPFIFPFGTLGAVIRMRGQMPDRKALFDIGVGGPLAGLAATIVVTVVGLSLGPVTVPDRVLAQSGEIIVFNNPPLLSLIADLLGRPTEYAAENRTVHPVVIGGWVGMFFTVLNLLPVGQLDGGHVLRAMIGERQESVAALVPGALFALAGYLHYVRGYGLDESVGLWAFWGFFSLVIAFNGAADPIDESGIGRFRTAVGLLTFGLGLLCFVVVPIEIMGA